MRQIVVALLLSSALSAAAQSTQPKDLRPLPEVPEPPELALPSPGVDEEGSSLEPRLPSPSAERIRSRNTALMGGST